MCTHCAFSADRIKSKWGVDLSKKNKIRTFAAENQIPNKKWTTITRKENINGYEVFA